MNKKFEYLKNQIEELLFYTKNIEKKTYETAYKTEAIFILENKISELQKKVSNLEEKNNQLETLCTKLATKESLANLVTKDDLKEIENSEYLARLITKDDIKNLAKEESLEKLATKESLANLVTKDDLKEISNSEYLARLITKDDIKNLAKEESLEKLATKENLEKLITQEDLDKSKKQLDNRIDNVVKDLNYKRDKYLPASKYEEALCDWYFEKMGKTLNLHNPKTYNEIIQWTKLYDFDDEKIKLVDKVLVRDWVKEKIGEKYLVPLIATYDSADQIDFDSLPQKFAIKCNHGCGYNIIVPDKSKLDIEDSRKKLAKWMNEDFSFRAGFEMQYSKIKRKILVEEYIENNNQDIYDYKVFCFGGKPKYILFITNRKTGIKKQIYDLDWNLQPFVTSGQLFMDPAPKPDNLQELIELAEILSKGFIQVRVDFYRLNDGSWKFGEMTFTDASGLNKWNPPETDAYFGSLCDLGDRVK